VNQIDIQIFEYFSDYSDGLPIPASMTNNLLNVQTSLFRLPGEFPVSLIVIVEDSDCTLAIFTFQGFR
jgi:hypothetical protein